MHPDQRTTVAGRYRLEQALVSVEHVTLWRGHDEVLDRAVTVRLVAATHPRVDDVLDAARSTSCVDDRRIARVLDADRHDDGVYVVTAWAVGTDLTTLLAEGPLEVDEALALVTEVADAVAEAHRHGIAHLALDPTNVVVGEGQVEGVTLLGLAVDAVLRGHHQPARPDQSDQSASAFASSSIDEAVVDARGLGALLYACLTARWPLDEEDLHGLAAAPRMGERLCTPRQVRAAVPAAVDTLCRRALADASAGPALDSPDAVAQAARDLVDDGARGRWRPSAWFGRGSGGSGGAGQR